ncbi:MAG: phosphoglucosamine mutase, partial [Myxococcota bacterium]
IFAAHSTTGDGLLAALQVLQCMKEEGKTLSELASNLRRYPQVLKNIAVREKLPWQEHETLRATIEDIERALGEEGRVLIRYSGTENKIRIMVEAQESLALDTHVQTLVSVFSSVLGETASDNTLSASRG